MSSSEDFNYSFIEHYPSCNYLQYSKSNNSLYLIRNYKGDKPSDEAAGISLTNLTDTSNEFFIFPEPGNIDSKLGKEENQFLSAGKALSPWLKFGLEKDPWKESEFQKMPRFVSPRKFKRGPLTGEIIISGISKLAQMPDTKSYAATKLQIADCRLTDVELLGRFHSFQYIDMSWNEISDMSPLSNMNYLMRLNASHNKIKEVLNMKAPWYLTFVSLACNEITYIRNLSEFWSLRYINFSYNHITKIEGLQNLKYLKHLNLSHNDITCLENLGGLNIEELNLEYNKIDCWEETKSGYLNISPIIKYINLSHNCLKSLCLLKSLDHLKELYVSHNLLSNIEELDYLKNMPLLQKISLEENEIAALDLCRHIIIYYLPQVNYIDGYKVLQAEKEANKVIFSQNILLKRYKNHAKLLFYEQLANPPLGRDIQPCGSKSFPIIALVGPLGCTELTISSKLEAELSKYVYLGNCHLMSNPSHKSYERFWRSNFIVNEEKFIDMIHHGEFLAVSEMTGGFIFGFSREQLAASIEKGKICLVNVDLLIAFSLQALGLNPLLILTIVKDYDVHLKKLLSVFSDREDVKLRIHSSFQKFRGSYYKCDDTSQSSTIEDMNEFTSSHPSSQSVSNNESSSEYFNVQENYSQNNTTIGMKPNKQDQRWLENITNSDVEENDSSKEADFSLLTKGSYGRLYSAESPVEIPSVVIKNVDSTVKNDKSNSFMLPLKSMSESNERIVTEEEKKILNDSKYFESDQNIVGSSERVEQLSNGKTISDCTDEASLLFSLTQSIQTPADKILQQKYPSVKPSNVKSSSRTLDYSKNETQIKNSLMKLMRNESTACWSWNYSADSIIYEDEGFHPVQSERSSTIMCLRTINYIIDTILASRPAYFELKDSGYFAHIVFTDNEEEAFQNLRKIIKDKCLTEKNWKSHCSFEKNLLYKEIVLRKTAEFMVELDKTESTACLSNK